jgi:hypothetical protein
LEKHQRILELLLDKIAFSEEEQEIPIEHTQSAFSEHDIRRLLFPEMEIEDVRIIVNEVCDFEINGGYGVVEYRDQDFGRNPLRFILKNIYTKKFYEAGGFIESKAITESLKKEESDRVEQEQRIMDLTEKNLTIDNKLKDYQDKYKVLDTFGKSLDLIIKSKTVILIVGLLSSFGILEVIRLGWKFLKYLL